MSKHKTVHLEIRNNRIITTWSDPYVEPRYSVWTKNAIYLGHSLTLDGARKIADERHPEPEETNKAS